MPYALSLPGGSRWKNQSVGTRHVIAKGLTSAQMVSAPNPAAKGKPEPAAGAPAATPPARSRRAEVIRRNESRYAALAGRRSSLLRLYHHRRAERLPRDIRSKGDAFGMA